MESFESLIQQAAEERASDLHLSVGIPPTIRVDGALLPLNRHICSPADVQEVADGIMNEHLREVFERDGEVDFAYGIPNVGRYRLNIYRQKGNCTIAARILNDYIPRPEDLGVPQALVDMCHKKSGLVLVTGPTGSGKSTTLASLIGVINRTYHYHIITMEDPIEYVHNHDKSIVNQREMGFDSACYATALRAALREDPDVILVGEMRDLETISAAITAAETGHLVFSTLHTIGAVNTIDRIIDVFPPHQQAQIRTQLADVLQCVVTQRLVPHVSGEGRVNVSEVMVVNAAISNQIREGKTFQIASSMQTSRATGMITMDDSLLDAYMNLEIDRDTALAYAMDPVALCRRLY